MKQMKLFVLQQAVTAEVDCLTCDVTESAGGVLNALTYGQTVVFRLVLCCSLLLFLLLLHSTIILVIF
jgi:hypothetical protein